MAYDNAELLQQNQLSVLGAYGFSEEYSEEDEFASQLIPNYMLRVGYGLADFTSLYVTWQRKSARKLTPLFPLFTDDYAIAQFDYFELSAKFPLIEDEMAFKTSLGFYLVNKDRVAQSLQTSFIYSHRFSKSTDIYFHLHGTGILERNGVQLLPGVNLGIGMSSNLDRWAIRPEIGYNLRTYTIGIGMDFKLGKNEMTEELPIQQ